MALLPAGGSISQDMSGRLQSADKLMVDFYAVPEIAGTSVTVQVGNEVKTIRIPETGTYSLEIPWQHSLTITITAGKKACLDNIRVYTYEQNGRIYSREGEETDLAGDFRILNGRLDETGTCNLNGL